MKYLLIVPPVLLLGLLVGAWGPKEELREVKRAQAELEARLARNEKDSRVDVLTRIVRIPDQASTPRLREVNKSVAASSQTLKKHARTCDISETNKMVGASEAVKAEPLRPDDLRARIDEAQALWETRVQIARAQWLERLHLGADGATLLDETIDLMNEDLYSVVQRLADRVAEGETMTPEEGMRVANELTATLVETYDTLASIVPGAQRGEVARLELTDVIDPGVATPLIAVQDRLGSFTPPRRRQGKQR